MNKHSNQDEEFLAEPYPDQTSGEMDAPIAEANGDDAEIADLEAYLQTLPHDRDALLRLSTLLYRNDRMSDAIHVLERLADVYADAGETEKAEQIRSVLASSHFLGESEDATLSESSSEEIPEVLPREQGYVHAAIDEIPCHDRVEPQRERLDFRPEALPFTIPLPGLERLDPVAKALVARTERDIANSHWWSALDSCDRVLAVAPGYIPILLRKAEIHVHQRRLNLARREAADLLGIAEADGTLKHLWTICRVLLHTSENPAFELSLTEKMLREQGLRELSSEYAQLLAEYLSIHGDPGEAMAFAESLLQTDPGNTDLAIDCAALHLKDGEIDQAVAVLSQAQSAGADSDRCLIALVGIAAYQSPDALWDGLVPFAGYPRSAELAPDLNRVLSHVYRSADIDVASHWLKLTAGREDVRDLLGLRAEDVAVSNIGRWMAVMGATFIGATDPHDQLRYLQFARELLGTLDLPEHGDWQGLYPVEPSIASVEAGLLKICREALPRHEAIAFLLTKQGANLDDDNVAQALVELLVADEKVGSALGILDRLAARAAEAGDVQRESAVLSQMAEIAPDSPSVKARQIHAEMRLGDHVSAFALLVEQADAEERSGNHGAATTSLHKAADLALGDGDPTAALTIFQEMARITPEDWAVRDALIELATETGELDLAAVHLRSSAKLAAEQADHARRLAHLRQLIDLRPDEDEHYYELANTLFEVGEEELAAKVLRFVRSEWNEAQDSAVASGVAATS